MPSIGTDSAQRWRRMMVPSDGASGRRSADFGNSLFGHNLGFVFSNAIGGTNYEKEGGKFDLVMLAV